MAAAAIGVFYAQKYDAYRKGYAAFLAGLPIEAFDGQSYTSPLARDGWNEGWRDAESGRKNQHEPSGTPPSKWQVFGYSALVVMLMVALAVFGK